MKLNFKLFFVCVLVVIIVLVCFFMISHMKNKNEEKITTTQIANPMKKSTPQEIINTIGVKFNEPKNVTEINYFIISPQGTSQRSQGPTLGGRFLNSQPPFLKL